MRVFLLRLLILRITIMVSKILKVFSVNRVMFLMECVLLKVSKQMTLVRKKIVNNVKGLRPGLRPWGAIPSPKLDYIGEVTQTLKCL